MRAEISSGILDEFRFPNCAGRMDGKLIYLDEAPVQDTIARYALSLLLVYICCIYACIYIDIYIYDP